MSSNVMGLPGSYDAGNNTIKFQPGTYNGAFMTANTMAGKVTIDFTGAIFTAPIYLPDAGLTDVDFINFSFAGVSTECFHWGNDGVKIGLNNVRFLNGKADKCGAFCWLGTPTNIKNLTGMGTNIELGNIVINKATTNAVFYLSKMFGLKVHDIIVAGAGSPALDNESHQGIFFLHWSDGELWNNNIQLGGGNGFRVWPANQDKRGQVYIHDNYVGNMRKYSAVEVNGYEVPDGFAGDVFIKNNTFGNLLPGNYQSAGLCVYVQKNATIGFDNNIVFNTSKGLIHYDGGAPVASNKNNFYFKTAQDAGVDSLTGRTLPTSPVYGKAGAWIPTIPIPLPNQVPVSSPSATQKTQTAMVQFVLDGSQSKDMDGTIVKYLWEQISGPAVVIMGPDKMISTVNDVPPGDFVFKLTVTDDKGAASSAVTSISVAEAPVVRTIKKVSVEFSDDTVQEITA